MTKYLILVASLLVGLNGHARSVDWQPCMIDGKNSTYKRDFLCDSLPCEGVLVFKITWGPTGKTQTFTHKAKGPNKSFHLWSDQNGDDWTMYGVAGDFVLTSHTDHGQERRTTIVYGRTAENCREFFSEKDCRAKKPGE